MNEHQDSGISKAGLGVEGEGVGVIQEQITESPADVATSSDISPTGKEERTHACIYPTGMPTAPFWYWYWYNKGQKHIKTLYHSHLQNLYLKCYCTNMFQSIHFDYPLLSGFKI